MGNSMGWSCDQRQLYYYVNRWAKKSNSLIKLTDDETQYNRLDRSDTEKILQNIKRYKEEIKNGVYSDFHMPTPDIVLDTDIINIF